MPLLMAKVHLVGGAVARLAQGFADGGWLRLLRKTGQCARGFCPVPIWSGPRFLQYRRLFSYNIIRIGFGAHYT